MYNKELYNHKHETSMKQITFLLSIFLLHNSIAMQLQKTEKNAKDSTQVYLAPAKAIRKTLQERITQKGRLQSLVDSQVADIGNDTAPAEVIQHRSTIDWRQLSLSVTRTGRLAQFINPQVTDVSAVPKQLP